MGNFLIPEFLKAKIRLALSERANTPAHWVALQEFQKYYRGVYTVVDWSCVGDKLTITAMPVNQPITVEIDVRNV